MRGTKEIEIAYELACGQVVCPLASPLAAFVTACAARVGKVAHIA